MSWPLQDNCPKDTKETSCLLPKKVVRFNEFEKVSSIWGARERGGGHGREQGGSIVGGEETK